VKALASLVSVATLLGLVTATGGAIVWLRFSAAELPAEHILRLTPKDDLVGVGGIALGLFAIAGAAAVVIAYLLDHGGSTSFRTILVLVTLAAAGMVYATYRLDRSAWFERGTAVGVMVVAAVVLALFAWYSRPVDKTPALTALAAVFAAPVVAALAAWLFVSSWFALMVVVATVLVALDLVIASETGFTFRWFGVTVFVSVVLFGAVLSVILAYDAPRLQPAAVLRSTDQTGGGIAAIYVAESSDRIYLARVDPSCRNGVPTDTPRAGTGRVFWVPRDQAVGVSIGTPERLGRALARAPILLEELETLRPTAAPQPPPAAAAGTAGADASSAAVSGGAAPAPAAPATRLSVAPVCPAPKPVTPPFHGSEVTDDQARMIAGRFRPWLLFDSGEQWRPLSIDAFLREEYRGREAAHHRLCTGVSPLQAGCSDVTDIADFGESIQTAPGLARRTYLDISGFQAPEYCAPQRCGQPPLDCDDCPSSTIYYRVSAANGRFYIDYWWFLRFNKVESRRARTTCRVRLQAARCFDHEGDWEGVTVVTSAQAPYVLEYASYAAHDWIRRHPRAKLQIREGSERPLVFIARGTHAAYPRSCPDPPTRRKKCNQDVPHFGILLPEGRHDGLGGWGRNEDAACFTDAPCLLPFPTSVASAVSWHSWEGSWGNCHRSGKRCQLGGGPESPANQRRFQNPTCFGSRKRVTCDPVISDSAAPTD
jgi:hypothetical protein